VVLVHVLEVVSGIIEMIICVATQSKMMYTVRLNQGDAL
jgi:hypothetical protein